MAKLYKDIFSENGIVNAMKENNNETFVAIFGNNFDVNLFDDYILFYNGNYEVLDNVQRLIDNGASNAEIANTMAKYIWLKYSSEWQNIQKTMNIDANILSNYYTTTTENNSNKQTTTENNSNSELNKKYAYDSENASNDTETTSTNSNTNILDNSGETTRIESGYKNNNITDSKQKAVDFEKCNSFIEIVKDDIIQMICIIIY